ncbi:MAG: MgtC/SapB family protein [Clostridia bacterium]|nr:MgtC/SapB family protein [Clostridia bacterium]
MSNETLWQVIGFNLPQECWEWLVRILVATLCGALIGLERGIRQKEAGIRTHCIVAMAAAIFMIISKYAFFDLHFTEGELLLGTKGADPSRIASQAVSAVGFLGAGIIFKGKGAVKGLTTAAGIWATAAIGLSIGAGLYTIGVASAILLLLVNICLHRWLIRLESMSTSEFSFLMEDEPEVLDHLRQQLDDRKIQVQSLDIKKQETGLLQVRIVARIAKNAALNDFLLFINDNPSIRNFTVQV